MWWWIAIGAVLAALFAAVLLSEVRVRSAYFREGEDDELDVAISALYGLVRFQIKMPTADLKPRLRGIRLKLKEEKAGKSPELDFSREDRQRSVRKLRLLIKHMHHFKTFLSGTMRHVHITEMRWETRFSAGNAAETGMMSGVIWGLQSTVLGIASRWMTFECRPALKVTPLYRDPTFRTDMIMVSRVRVHRLLFIAFMLMYRVGKSRAGWAVWLRTLLGRRAPNERPA